MKLIEYMNTHFPGLLLRPPLFYEWDAAIRFELGGGFHRKSSYENSPYIKRAYHRAITLFESLHAPNEDICIVADVFDNGSGKILKRKLNVFAPYTKSKATLFNIKHSTIPFVFQEEDEEEKFKTHRFTLTCKTSDIKHVPLLKAICNHDVGIKPQVYHSVYFLNLSNNTIFHVYDDRGCDLVAETPEAIKEIYTKHNDWIVDYDREEIDAVFI